MLLMVAALGVALGGNPEPERPRIQHWEMLDAQHAVILDTTACKINGRIDDEAKQRVLALAGRVKGIFPKVRRLDACWDEYTVAARVLAGNLEIYCTMNDAGQWSIVKVIRWQP
jgi:hypothetical protein